MLLREGIKIKKEVVPRAGLEPARHRCHRILNPTCLPISPPRRTVKKGLVFY